MLDPPYVSSQLTRFMERRGLAVVDVVRGAAQDSRRLFLGDPGSDSVTHVVATSHGPTTARSIENEQLVLQHANQVLAPRVRQSLPRVLERVDVPTSMYGLAMTAVPHLGAPGARSSRRSPRDLLASMPGWLAAVWSDSASGTAPLSLGEDAMRLVLAERYLTSTPEPALAVLGRARDRLARFDVPQTLTHGCLCPRHVMVSDGTVGVDDWGLGAPSGDPVREVGHLAVNVADGRLAEVLVGRTSFGTAIRHFMTEAMAHTPVPARLWREVLVLSQLELAIEGLRRGTSYGMVRLSRAVRALQGSERSR